MLKKIILAVVLVVLAVGGYFVYSFGPRNVIGILMYDTRREGSLKVGDQAPEIMLVGLDGQADQSLKARMGDKPLVLIFGSFT